MMFSLHASSKKTSCRIIYFDSLETIISLLRSPFVAGNLPTAPVCIFSLFHGVLKAGLARANEEFELTMTLSPPSYMLIYEHMTHVHPYYI
jgi:hypothetical protein